MALREDLKLLARIPRSSYPFLTLYLNTRWDSEKQRERVRIFVKTKLRECIACVEGRDEGARGSLEDDAEKANHYVKGLVNREWDEGFDGIAMFACSGMGIYRVVRSHFAFEEAFHCATRPALRPAVQQSHVGESAILCLAGGNSGRLLEFELGGVRREFSFQDEEFPGRHEQGGWSQTRYQRHIEEHLCRNLRRLVDNLIRWKDERGVRRIVLSGPDSDLALLEGLLPKRVRHAICARLHIEPTATPDIVEAAVQAALRAAQEEEDRRTVDSLLDRAVGSGRAVTGLETVAGAVKAGRVHILYLDTGFQQMGWKCFDCGSLQVGEAGRCPVCGAALESVELGEELVRGTLAADGAVVPLGEHAALRAEGGAAALLRYG